MRNADDLGAIGRAVVRNVDCQHHGGRAAHHVLHRREGGALAAELARRRSGVRIGIEVAAGVHHHAELGEQQRQRQHMHEPAAITSNQEGLRGASIPAGRAADKLSSAAVMRRGRAPSVASRASRWCRCRPPGSRGRRPCRPAARARHKACSSRAWASRAAFQAARRFASSASLTSRCSFRAGTSSSMMSPVLTSASGPPAAASGATCSTTVPYAVPLMRASEMRTMSVMPLRSTLGGSGMLPTSAMPGYPFGPQPLSTMMQFSSMSRSRRRSSP